MLTVFVTYFYFLGLRNLTVIEDAERQIREFDPTFNIDDVPDDDPETFAMLAEGKTQGVFQLESAGITGVCVNMKPTSIEDMTAIVALYRPGPMDSIPKFIANKQDPSKITYKTPHLEPILRVTYGCIVYQEQVIEIFRSLGGYTMGQADNIRRAISKKKMKVIEAERKVFVYGDPAQNIPGAIANGVSEAAAQSIYDEIVDFANYAFNKAHAVCYAVVSYQTAWLKCHYPKQYMAALMTSVLSSSTKLAGYINECKDLGIKTLPPDINHSVDHFAVEGASIRFGMAALKSIGRALTKVIVSVRQEGGLFTSLEDFVTRMPEREINKRTVENLIKAGAMDCFGHHRSELLAAYEGIMDCVFSSRRKNLDGQMGMFAMIEEESCTIEIPSLPELSKGELMLMEKETTGIYLSGHPMDDFRGLLKNTRVIPIGALMDEESTYEDGQFVTVAGVVSSVKMKTTRNNSMMAYVVLEDDTAGVEMLVFAKTLDQFGDMLVENRVRVILGKVSIREDKEPQLIVNRVWDIRDYDPDAVPGRPGLPHIQKEGCLYLRLKTKDERLFGKVRAILNMFPGGNMAVVYFEDTKQRLGTHCALDSRMLDELRSLLGAENVVVK